MMHDEGDSVMSIAFGHDHEGFEKVMVVSGSRNGHIKVWLLATGDCVRSITHAHQKSVSSVCFGSHSITDSSSVNMILSGGLDGSVRIHGLNTGKLLKQFNGHTSFVNTVAFARDGNGSLVPVSGASDGSVRVWNIKSMECTRVIMPGGGASVHTQLITEITVHRVIPVTRGRESLLLVCNASNKGYLIDLAGQVVQTFSSVDSVTGEGANVVPVNFTTCAVSPTGDFAYFVDEKKELFCFDTNSGRIQHRSGEPIHTKDVLGLIHHTSKSMLASYSIDGTLKMWR
jgi:WD40 repeat-containing protein SMU1